MPPAGLPPPAVPLIGNGTDADGTSDGRLPVAKRTAIAHPCWRSRRRQTDASPPMAYPRKGTAIPPSGDGIGSSGLLADGDPFRVLGLAPGASAAEIKHAYRTLSARYHPDAAAVQADNGIVASRGADEAAERFLAVQRAYAVLTDRHGRAFWESRATLSECGEDMASESHPRAVTLLLQRRVLRGDAADSVLGHLVWAMTAFWRQRRDALRLVSWAASLFLGVVIVLLSFAPADLFRPNAGGTPRPGGSAAATTADAELRLPPAAGPVAPVTPRSRAVPPGESAVPPRPTGMAGVDGADASPTAPHPARFPVFAGPAFPASPEAVATPIETPADGSKPGESMPEPIRTATGPRLSARPVPRGEAARSAEAEQPPPADTPRWLGAWTATCLLPQPGRLFLGDLELAGDARFRWRELRTAGTRSNSDTADNRSPLVFQLEPDGAAGRRVALRERSGPHSPPVAMLELTGSSLATLRFLDAATPAPTACLRWQLYRQSPPPPLEGLWVLTADAPPSGTRIAPAYLELRIERRGAVREAVFQGKYTVPVDSIAPVVEFRFQLPVAESLESVPWQDDAGSRGLVSLVPIAPSRLAVHWVRVTPSHGRPQLSSGISILRRME